MRMNVQHGPWIPALPSNLQLQYRSVVRPGGHLVEAYVPGSPQPVGKVELRRVAQGRMELENLRVSDAYRRQHFGSSLVQRAVMTARLNGAVSVSLEVRPSSGGAPVPALLGMYGRLGFRLDGPSPRGNPRMSVGVRPPAPPFRAAPAVAKPAVQRMRQPRVQRLVKMAVPHAPPVVQLRRSPFPAANSVVQRAEWKRTEFPVETTAKTHKLRWIWSNKLTLNVAGIPVPVHSVHNTNVTPNKGAKGNRLYGSCTVVWMRGSSVDPHQIQIKSGDPLGPFEAQLSEAKTGHTEQQLGPQLKVQIQAMLGAAPGDDWQVLALVLEVHQTNTPCSGPKGCALYLERLIAEIEQTYPQLLTIILRASARQLYESSAVHTYPGAATAATREIHDEPLLHTGLEGEVVVVHSKV